MTLTGHVRIWAEHDAAIDAAWMATGVYDDVRNGLDVTGRYSGEAGSGRIRPYRASYYQDRNR